MFTSANGVDCFFERIEAKGLDARAFAGLKLAAVGGVTAGQRQELAAEQAAAKES